MERSQVGADMGEYPLVSGPWEILDGVCFVNVERDKAKFTQPAEVKGDLAIIHYHNKILTTSEILDQPRLSDSRTPLGRPAHWLELSRYVRAIISLGHDSTLGLSDQTVFLVGLSTEGLDTSALSPRPLYPALIIQPHPMDHYFALIAEERYGWPASTLFLSTRA